MRVTPPNEMLEYLDSIGVKPPVDSPGKKPSPIAKSKRSGNGKTGCLMFLLMPAAGIAVASLASRFFVICFVCLFMGVGATAQDTKPLNQSRSNFALQSELETNPDDHRPEKCESFLFANELKEGHGVIGDDWLNEVWSQRLYEIQPGGWSISDRHSKKNTLDEFVPAWVPPRSESEFEQYSIGNTSSKEFDGVDDHVPYSDEVHGTLGHATARSAINRESLLHSHWMLCFGVILVTLAGCYLYSESSGAKSNHKERRRLDDLKQSISGVKGFVESEHLVSSNDSRRRDLPANVVECGTSRNPKPTGHEWRIGFHSAKGNVRAENQDFAVGFEVNDFQVLLVADGCGGVPFGAEASRTAIEACAKQLTWALVTEGASVDEAISMGFQAAANALVEAGTSRELVTLESGLRTTLLVAVGTSKELHWGYIGDGAIKTINPSNGNTINRMQAHRADENATNILAASLGPIPHGNPTYGSMRRKAGDILLMGTDGVFDRVDRRFETELMRMAVFHNGDLEKATREAVSQLAEMTDSGHSYICDDNLTLGLMMDGTSPNFQPKFWNQAIQLRKKEVRI